MYRSSTIGLATLILGSLFLAACQGSPQKHPRAGAEQQSVTAMLQSLRFHDAHQQLLHRITTGDDEAHFELARALLLELSWASAIDGGGNLPPRIQRLIGDNPMYSVFVPNPDGTMLLEQNRIGTLPMHVVINYAWLNANYPDLVALQLEEYLRSPAQANRATAEKWKSIVISSIDHAPGESGDLPPLAKERGLNSGQWESIGAVANILTHIQVGDVVLEPLPTK